MRDSTASPLHTVSDGDPAADLHDALTLLRIAGPLPQAASAAQPGDWVDWLAEGRAAREMQALAHIWDSARRGDFASLRQTDTLTGPEPLDDPVCPDAIRRWLGGGRHPRPLLRWCRRYQDSHTTPGSLEAVAVALAAFQIPLAGCAVAWTYLRWRGTRAPVQARDPATFLDRAAPLLPALCRTALRSLAVPARPGADTYGTP